MTTDSRPFTLVIGDDDLADLHRRLDSTRWPDPLPGEPWSRGVPVDYLRRIVETWRHGFDWRAAEARLDALPQFTTDIDDATIYYQHIRSSREGARPLLLCHGWPGSVAEFERIIRPLTEPDDGSEAFHLVIPALPGFPLSTVRGSGWNAGRIAGAFVEVMARLGYERYFVQGGDLGAIVGPAMARKAPDRVIGVHVNAATMGFIPWGDVPEDVLAGLDERERTRLERLGGWMAEESGYMRIQGTKPETLGYGMTDSPVALLGWIIEKFHGWTAFDAALPEDAVDLDQLLTDVSLYWFTRSMPSSMNVYYEDQHTVPAPPEECDVPIGVTVFENEVAMRTFGEQGNRIVSWHDIDEGGHFAAMETPDLLVADIRAFARTVDDAPPA